MSCQHTERQDGGYSITVTPAPLPGQPDRMVQMLLSIIVSDSNFSSEISTAVVGCLADNTRTENMNWGLYGAKWFTPSLLQAEYYVHVSEEDSLTFPRIVDDYIQSNNLTICVTSKNVNFPPNGNLSGGRTAVAPRSAAIVSSSGAIPSWIIAAAVGGVALVAIIALMVTSVREQRIYAEKDYDSAVEETEDMGLADGDPDVMSEEDPSSADLDVIAGQREGSLLA